MGAEPSLSEAQGYPKTRDASGSGLLQLKPRAVGARLSRVRADSDSMAAPRAER